VRAVCCFVSFLVCSISLQLVAVHCSVLPELEEGCMRFFMCCSVLQRVAVCFAVCCCSVSQRVAGAQRSLHAILCVLQRVAACCSSVLQQCVAAVCCSVLLELEEGYMSAMTYLMCVADLPFKILRMCRRIPPSTAWNSEFSKIWW